MGEIWQIAWGLGMLISIAAVTVYTTRKNTSAIDSLKDNEIKDLYEKVNSKMDEKVARAEFVSTKVNDVQIKHIDKTLAEIKQGQDKILNCLLEKK